MEEYVFKMGPPLRFAFALQVLQDIYVNSIIHVWPIRAQTVLHAGLYIHIFHVKRHFVVSVQLATPVIIVKST